MASESASPPMPVASGSECVIAEGACRGGACKVEVHNECGAPMRCELSVLGQCQRTTARAKATAVDVFQPDSAGNLDAAPSCEGAALVVVAIASLKCAPTGQ